MDLKVGIVGMPNVGKSTLFQTLTKKQVDIANYPFCTIEPNIGVVSVPDYRLDKLANFSNSKKIIPAVVEFVDIAGLVEGANKGEGLGNQFLSHIREVDAVIYVLRAFENNNIINVLEGIDPIEAKNVLDTELLLKDLDTVEKRLFSLVKEVRAGGADAKKELVVFEKLKDNLNKGIQIRDINLDDNEKLILKNYSFLTNKPCLYLLNGVDEEVDPKIISFFESNNYPYLIIDIQTEFDVVSMSKEERETLGLSIEGELDILIRRSYKLLNLITFFTTGEDETRAWTINRGTLAPQAGGVIHTDFEAKFIKASVIDWKKLLECGSFEKARSLGLIRSEGKEYLVNDGDVIEFKHGQ
jgi:ribosome-binding ATPase